MATGVSTEIWLVRHGESLWNAEGRIQGGLDVPLSDRGRRQAYRLAQRLRTVGFDALYSSPLRRAAETAVPIAEALGLRPEVEPDLREMGLGQWEGLTWQEAAALSPAAWEAYRAAYPWAAPPDGESLEAVVARARQVVLALARRHPGRRLAAVTHGGLIRAALVGLVGFPLAWRSRLAVYNASWSVLRVDPGEGLAQLICLNDTCHLWEEEGVPWHS